MILPKLETLGPGAQVIYVPNHADGDIRHPDCEAGFIVKLDAARRVAYCGFYSNLPGPHLHDVPALRTTANGESVSFDYLVPLATRAQWIVDNDLERITRAMAWAQDE